MALVRAYLPTTLPQLAARLSVDARTGRVLDPSAAVAAPGDIAFAVTPALREWYREGDAEELEYAAYTRAAHAGLRLLAAATPDGALPDAGAPQRRVVLAVEIPDQLATPLPGSDPAALRLLGAIGFDAVASAHVDDPDAAADVAAAVAAVDAAAAGDPDAQFAVDAVDDHELAWYAVQEIGFLLL